MCLYCMCAYCMCLKASCPFSQLESKTMYSGTEGKSKTIQTYCNMDSACNSIDHLTFIIFLSDNGSPWCLGYPGIIVNV